MPLIIAQCATKKTPGTVAAFDKYVTRNHAAIRAFMMGTNGNDGAYMAGWDWSVLSAQKGLLHPTTAVEDYDAQLKNDADVAAFVETHGAQIRAEVESNDAAGKVLFVGSKLYLKALRAALPNRNIQHIGEGGRGCGDYFSALQSGFDLYSEDA